MIHITWTLNHKFCHKFLSNPHPQILELSIVLFFLGLFFSTIHSSLYHADFNECPWPIKFTNNNTIM